MRCGASCLLAPVALSQGASKQLAPHLFNSTTTLIFPPRLLPRHIAQPSQPSAVDLISICRFENSESRRRYLSRSTKVLSQTNQVVNQKLPERMPALRNRSWGDISRR